MANENDTLFSINAGELLAKLHLAGCQTYTKDQQGNPIHFYNSGYPASDEGRSPEKPGDTLFDLKNVGGTYEVGCAMTGLVTYKWLSEEEYNKLTTGAMEILTNADKKDAQPTDPDKADEETKKKMQPIYDALAKVTETKKECLGNDAKYKGNQAELRKFAFTYLAQDKGYMQVFCGKENSSKIKDNEMVAFGVKTKFDYKYDKYVIPEENDKLQKSIQDAGNEKHKKLFADLGKMIKSRDFDKYADAIEKLSDDKGIDEYFKIVLDDKSDYQLGFKIGYAIEVGTM